MITRVLIPTLILLLTAMALLSYTQDVVIKQQRALILSMAANPACLVVPVVVVPDPLIPREQ